MMKSAMAGDVKKTALSITRWVGSAQSIVAHTIVFVASFIAAWTGFIDVDRMLLVLTTLVSLEAIYLAIFIQMTINEQAADIDEIQEDIEEIQEDVEEIQEDDKEDEARESADHKALEEIRHGLAKLMKDLEGIQKI